eukprot:2106230-Rhodomonas_salina.1
MHVAHEHIPALSDACYALRVLGLRLDARASGSLGSTVSRVLGLGASVEGKGVGEDEARGVDAVLQGRV